MARTSKPNVVRLGPYRLHYREYGAGPPLVLIHGLSGSASWWRRNVPALSERFRVLVLELVGYGSNRAWRPARILATADLLAEFIATLPEGRAHVIGHSMGGQIATQLAGRRPDRVDRLVLASASGLLRTDLLRMALRLPLQARHSPFDFAPRLTVDALRAGPLNLLLSALDILRDDVSEAIAHIRTPTLLIWGRNDKLVPVAVGETVQRLIPGSRLAVLPRAGHVPMWDRPAEFNRLVVEFLSEGAERGRQGEGETGRGETGRGETGRGETGKRGDMHL
jgi:pimeloyl-ACP methyl ester carboxylesterase